jgi:lysophospholipid acyltransferase
MDFKNPFDHLDQPFVHWGAMLGLPPDQIKMIFSLLICFPMGMLFRLLKDGTTRHIAATVAGVFLTYLNYRNEIVHVFVTAAITYIILKSFSKDRNTGALITLAFNVAYLSIYHIYAMITNYGGWKVDISIVLMMNVAKFTSLAWCFKDGAEPKDNLSKDQWQRRVENLPTLLEYNSYLFFYATSLAGPAFDFREYNDFINVRGDFEYIPYSLLPGLLSLVYAFIAMGLVIAFTESLSPKHFHEDWWTALPFWEKVMRMDVGSFIIRCRYYTAWLIATGSTIMSGFSYNGKNEKGGNKWDRVVSVRPVEFETGDNQKDKLEAWNTSVQIWLKKYIFLRICPESQIKLKPKRAALASNLTFLMSAFWHGFYPAYYVAFFSLFLMQQISKFIFNWRHIFKVIPAPVAFLIRWIFSTWVIDYNACAFAILEFSKFIPFWKSIYFFMSIMLVIGYIVTLVVGSPRKKKVEGPKTTTGETATGESPEKLKAN